MRRIALVLSCWAAAASAHAQTTVALSLPSGALASGAQSVAQERAMVRLAMASEIERVPEAERESLAAAIDSAYGRHAEGPSVWLASATHSQSADAFDALLVEPAHPSDLGVVFLHGLGGNFSWPCHAIADALAPLGARTLCPSLDRDGHWATGAGPGIVTRSIEALRARGASRILLVGLSNGAAGASRLARRLRSSLSGLVLVSGVARGARTTLPALVVHGTRDAMAPIASARAFVGRSPAATLATFDGGHFVLATHESEISGGLRAWTAQLAVAP